MRRRICRGGVDELRLSIESLIEHCTDVGGVVLTVFIHRDDPLARRGAHARKGGGVLPEITREPYRADEGVLGMQPANGLVGTARAAIPNQNDLRDPEGTAPGGDSLIAQGGEFSAQTGEGRLAGIDGDDHADIDHVIARGLRHACKRIAHLGEHGSCL